MHSCSICFEPLISEESCKTCCIPCGHVFHHQCLINWFQTQRETYKRHRSCPQCRHFFSKQQIIKLYFNDETSESNETDENARLPPRQIDDLLGPIKNNEEQLRDLLSKNSQWVTQISDYLKQTENLIKSAPEEYDNMVELVSFFLQNISNVIINMNVTNDRLTKEINDTFVLFENHNFRHLNLREKYDWQINYLQNRIASLESNVPNPGSAGSISSTLELTEQSSASGTRVQPSHSVNGQLLMICLGIVCVFVMVVLLESAKQNVVHSASYEHY